MKSVSSFSSIDITKIQELRPLGPNQGFALDPLGALPRPHDPICL